MARVWKARLFPARGGHAEVRVFSAPHPDHTYASVGHLTVEAGEEAADLADLLSRVMPVERVEASDG